MRCTCCGNPLNEDEPRCPRCQADQTSVGRRRRLVISLFYVFIAILCVSLLICVVLYWHETQSIFV